MGAPCCATDANADAAARLTPYLMRAQVDGQGAIAAEATRIGDVTVNTPQAAWTFRNNWATFVGNRAPLVMLTSGQGAIRGRDDREPWPFRACGEP